MVCGHELWQRTLAVLGLHWERLPENHGEALPRGRRGSRDRMQTSTVQSLAQVCGHFFGSVRQILGEVPKCQWHKTSASSCDRACLSLLPIFLVEIWCKDLPTLSQLSCICSYTSPGSSHRGGGDPTASTVIGASREIRGKFLLLRQRVGVQQMGKGRRLNVITAILKINVACSTPISDCTDKAGQGQRGVGSRQRLQELKQNKSVSDSVHSDQHHGGKT